MIVNPRSQSEDFVLWTGTLPNANTYRVRGVHAYVHRGTTYTDVVEKQTGDVWRMVRDNLEAREVFDAFLASAFKVPEVGVEKVTWDLSRPLETLVEEVEGRWPGKFIRLNSDRVSAWIHDGTMIHAVLRSPEQNSILWSGTGHDKVSYRIRAIDPYVLFGMASQNAIERYQEGAWVPVENEVEQLDVRYMSMDDMFAQSAASAPTLEMDLTVHMVYILREMWARFPGLQVRFRSDLKVAWVHDIDLNVHAILVHKSSNVVWVSKILDGTIYRVLRKEGCHGVRNDKISQKFEQGEWKPVDFILEMAILDVFLSETFLRLGDGVEEREFDLSQNRLKLFVVVQARWPKSYTKIDADHQVAWIYNEERVLARITHKPPV